MNKALRSPRAISLRTKLVALLLTVEAIVLAFLVWQGWVLDLHRVERDMLAGLTQMRPWLNAAVAPSLAARDVATLQRTLDAALASPGLRYALARDRDGNILARAGRLTREAQRPDATLEEAMGHDGFDTRFPVTLRGVEVGALFLGLSIDRELGAAHAALRESAARALGAFLFSLLVFLALIQPLARRLGRMERAAERIAAGDFNAQLNDTDADEVGHLARAFDRMAEMLRSRVGELERSREHFHAIADYTYDVECWFSAAGELLWINSSVERLTGYSAAECLAAKDFPWFLVHADDIARVRTASLNAPKEQGTGTNFEFRICKKDGQIEWLTNSWQPIFSPEGAFLGLRSSLNSIQQLKRVEIDLRTTLARLEDAGTLQSATAESLRAERSRLISLLSAMSFGVVFVDRSQRIVYSNPAFCEVWSIPRGEPILGLNLFEALQHAEDVLSDLEVFPARLAELLADESGTSNTELRLLSGRILKLQVCPVIDEQGHFQGSVLIHEDITLAREAENQLAFLAERDPLTGLFNRRRFEHELGERLEAAVRTKERVALFFFDLDEFKSVNDLFGHRMGDTVLLQVAGEIRTSLRRNEFFARIGGDEFALVVTHTDDVQIRALAERLMRVIGNLSVSLGEVRLSLTASLGVAICPDHARDPQELIAHADAAMYQAKDAGKNTWRVFRPDHVATLRQRSLVTWNDRLRHALRNETFELHLQGVFCTHTRARRYSEALLRLPDETTGRLLPPSQFIPFAEKSNLILDIDRWTVNAVIEQLAQDPHGLPIAVNVSGRSFDEPEIAEFIALKLADSGVDPARLFVEITETAAIRDMRDAQRFIDRLHAIGCKVCLDDFGAGFASFAYIKQLGVDVLKIDGIFIRNLARSRDNQVFVRAMLDIARGFDKAIVAEAVEDEASLDVLRSYGIDMVQGFALERPQPAPKRIVRAASLSSVVALPILNAMQPRGVAH